MNSWLNNSLVPILKVLKKNPASFQLRGFADTVPDVLGDLGYPAACRNNFKA
jgi:hypothetical protein